MLLSDFPGTLILFTGDLKFALPLLISFYERLRTLYIARPHLNPIQDGLFQGCSRMGEAFFAPPA